MKGIVKRQNLVGIHSLPRFHGTNGLEKNPHPDYTTLYTKSLIDPDGFWFDRAKKISWFLPPSCAKQTIPEESGRGVHKPTWFPDGLMNICFNCVDRHVLEGRGSLPALIFDSAMTKETEQLTYIDLLNEVELLAHAMRCRGLKRGDRVLIYMPMIPAAIIAMLAVARLGAIHVVVFGGFSGNEVGRRLADVKPALLLTASSGIEPTHWVPYIPLLEDAFVCHPELARPPLGTLVYQRGSDLKANLSDPRYAPHYTSWQDFVRRQNVSLRPDPGSLVICESMAATDPLFILHTSGTTGTPKGLIRTHGAYSVGLDTAMDLVYGMSRNEGCWWAASDIGWIVGHSFTVYGPLLHGNSTVIFEGKPVGTPDAGVWGRIIENYEVKSLFAAPTAVRAIRGADPEGGLIRSYDISSLERVFLAGEHCDVATLKWARTCFKCAVIDHYWMTESGSPMVANCAGAGFSNVPDGSCGLPVFGHDIAVLDSETGQQITKPRVSGDICVKLPLPPGFATSLWPGSTDLFIKKYLHHWPGWFFTSDIGYKDEHGYLFVMSRSDDVINVAGHRISGGALEEVISSYELVAECAVVGTSDEIKGEVPVGFVVLKNGCTQDEHEIEKDLSILIRNELGPVAAFKHCHIIPKLPKTRSGKILRKTLKLISEGASDIPIPATIEDAVVIADLKHLFSKLSLR